jgi:hypothetical protein
MQDRISNHPNRWVLTPVPGETNTYDFTRADDPTVTGTPLNKATFLPDAVAAAVEAVTGESGIALPADALDAIATALNTLGLTNNAKLSYGSWTGTGSGSSRSFTFSWTPYIVVATKADYAFSGGDNANSGADSFLWLSGQTTTGPRTFSLSGTKLTWQYTNNSYRDRENLNESGSSYLIVGVCIK